MALKLAGEKEGYKEKIESIFYNPSLQDTGDLEAGTKTITATSEASGVENADYSNALTLAKPDDARLIVKRIAARLAVTIDSFDLATHLYCRVYVDAQDADHRLFDMDWDSTGARTAAVDWTYGTIFDLLKDGQQHIFYFFFWVNQANNAVISLVQLWEMVGTKNGSLNGFLYIDHSGYISFGLYAISASGGTFNLSLGPANDVFCWWKQQGVGDHNRFSVENILIDKAWICGEGGNTDSIVGLAKLSLILRSEQ